MDPFSNPIDSLMALVRAQVSARAADQLDRMSDAYGREILALRLIPAEEILTPDERAILAEVEREDVSPIAFRHPSLVIILKATRLCNLRCTYCNSWRAGPGQVMDFATLATMTRSTLLAPGLRQLQIVWHGGEVTLLSTAFMRKALWLQERYRGAATQVDNCIQTNATRLTPDWIDFLRAHRVSVGVSIDASPEVHDRRRVTKSGRGTWDATLGGMAMLRAAGVPFGVLAVIDEEAMAIGARTYLERLDALDVRGVALLNALPSNDSESVNSDAYLDWGNFQSFLREMFAIWWVDYRDRFEIRELQALVDAVEGRKHGLCIYAGNCMGKYLTVEPDGRTSACEKYVGNPDYAFGTLSEGGVADLLSRGGKLGAAMAVVDAQKARAETTCDYFRYCQGGCPHDDLNNQRFGRHATGCCGMRALIGDIIAAVNKESEDECNRTIRHARGVDIGAGPAGFA